MPVAQDPTPAVAPPPSLQDLKAAAHQPVSGPALRPWNAPEVTKEKLDFVSLELIDLSRLDTSDPADLARLVAQTKKALTVDGFIAVTGTGVSDETLARQLSIAQLVLADVPREDKLPYAAKLDEGSYVGYKLLGVWERNGVRDNVESYNLESPSFSGDLEQHPSALRPFIPEIESFARYTYHRIVRRILTLISLVLELEPDALWNLHSHEEPMGAASQRYQRYTPRTEGEHQKTNNISGTAHSDYNSVSLLFSQPVSGLQILTRENEWKWVKHVQGAVIVNVADALEFISGGLLKSTQHRVYRPPADQDHLTRFILIHFARFRRDVRLNPIAESPLVQREGKNAFQARIDAGGEAPTQGTWLQERIRRTGREPDASDLAAGGGKVAEDLFGTKITTGYQ